MDVLNWLQSIGLSEYANTFREHSIDVPALLALTNEDLKELGIAKLGHRKCLFAAIQGFSNSTDSLTAVPQRRPGEIPFTEALAEDAEERVGREAELKQLVDAVA